MEFYCVLRYIKVLGDLLIGAAAYYHPEDIGLALRQLVACGKSLDVVYFGRYRMHIHDVIQVEKEEYADDEKQGHHSDQDHRPVTEHNA